MYRNIKYRTIALVSLLIHYGADPYIKNLKDQICFDIADELTKNIIQTEYDKYLLENMQKEPSEN